MKRLVHREAGQAVFQRSYHEHGSGARQITGKTREYIDTNPAKRAEYLYYAAQKHPVDVYCPRDTSQVILMC